MIHTKQNRFLIIYKPFFVIIVFCTIDLIIKWVNNSAIFTIKIY